jgi:hypothetical protein
MWLKGKNVVFGKAINGLEVISDMEAGFFLLNFISVVSSDNGVPKA